MPQQITTAVRLPEEAQPPRNELELIQRLALDLRVDPEKLQRLLDMRFAVEKHQAVIEYRQAMTRLQPKLPTINKRGRIQLNKGSVIKYARYDDIHKAVMPLLNGEGFAVSFDTEDAGAKTKVTCTLSHSAGHAEKSSITLPSMDTSGAKGQVQQAGSVVSYGKRYTLCQILNILTEDQDDDGTGHGVSEPITLEQKNQILDLLHAAIEREPDAERHMNAWLGHQGITKIEDIPQGPLFEQVIQSLRRKIK